MIVPRIGSRVEETDQVTGFGIVTGGVRSLRPVAVRARETGVVQSRPPMMFSGSDIDRSHVARPTALVADGSTHISPRRGPLPPVG